MTALAAHDASLASMHSVPEDSDVAFDAPHRAQRRYLHDASPWRVRDVSRVGVLFGLGVLGVGACWYGISGEDVLRNQEGWIVGALAATVLAALGMAGWLTAGLREVRRGQRELCDDLRSLFDVMLDDDADFAFVAARTDDPQLATGRADVVLFTSASMTKAHRAGCPLTAGKAMHELELAEAEARGLARCGVCLS